MKTPLKIGDRVRLIRTPKGGVPAELVGHKGTITMIDHEDAWDLLVKFEGHKIYSGPFWVSSKHVRRPRSRAKPEMVDVWIKNKRLSEILEATEKRVQIVFQGEGRGTAMWGASKALEFAAPFICAPGEVIVSREALAKAWDQVVTRSAYWKGDDSGGTHAKAFCKALGLNSEDKNG